MHGDVCHSFARSGPLPTDVATWDRLPYQFGVCCRQFQRVPNTLGLTCGLRALIDSMDSTHIAKQQDNVSVRPGVT